MNQMKVIGGVVFLILAFVGFMAYKDYSKKAAVEADAKAVRYLMTLIREDTAVNLNAETGGPVLHPWVLASTPQQTEVEDKVGLDRNSEDKWFTWTMKGDPDGGQNLRDLTVSAQYDQQGNLQVLKGLKGTVGISSAFWQP